MIKEYFNILKNYYSVIHKDKKKLYPYYVGYICNIIVELIIPICVTNITEKLTGSYFVAAIVCVFLLLFLNVLNSLLSFIDMHFYAKFFKANYVSLYKQVINKIYDFDEEYKKTFSTGKLLNSMTSDVVNIGEMADNILTISLNIIKWFIILIYFSKISIVLALGVMLLNIVYIILSNYLNNKSISNYLEQRKHNDSLISLINQTLLGLKDVKTMNFSSDLNKKYNAIYKKWGQAYFDKRRFYIYRVTFLKIMLELIKCAIYIYCIIAITKDNMSIGTLLLIISYYTSFFSASSMIMSCAASMKEENVSLNRIKEILDYWQNIQYENKIIKDIEGVIEFKNVSFSYNEKKLLKNISFTINSNKITAIIGENGSGKTTILNLILRLYFPSKGSIYLDNQNILNIKLDSYLNNISVLNQDTYLFNLSIRDNFNLINKDKKVQERICKLVGIDKFIKSLPKGYNTVISENSTNISGGQKRLLSIARTLMKDSKILLFDEITSSLDMDITKQVINVLNKLKENHTIIIVTHKKELIDIADEIIKLCK